VIGIDKIITSENLVNIKNPRANPAKMLYFVFFNSKILKKQYIKQMRKVSLS